MYGGGLLTVFDGTYRTVPPFAVIAFFSSVLFLGSKPKIETSTPLRQSPPSWLSPFFLVAIVKSLAGTRIINNTTILSICEKPATTIFSVSCRPTTSTHATAIFSASNVPHPRKKRVIWQSQRDFPSELGVRAVSLMGKELAASLVFVSVCLLLYGEGIEATDKPNLKPAGNYTILYLPN